MVLMLNDTDVQDKFTGACSRVSLKSTTVPFTFEALVSLQIRSPFSSKPCQEDGLHHPAHACSLMQLPASCHPH